MTNDTAQPTQEQRDHDIFYVHFGVCPECHWYTGRLNTGRGHWGYCTPHKTTWSIGSNLFSDWKDQSEEEQRRIYDEVGLDAYTEVEPWVFKPRTEPYPACEFCGKPAERRWYGEALCDEHYVAGGNAGGDVLTVSVEISHLGSVKRIASATPFEAIKFIALADATPII